MNTDNLIPVTEFCLHHKIEHSFVFSLHESGLLEMITMEQKQYLPAGELKNLEKMVTLYYEMNINIEGIETINYLLQRLQEMQQKIVQLKNKLDMYEPIG
jgi:chaperone modulatory protein CbpM